ncbi:hypothetical protein RHS02_06332, partial [Rhizoctonia solani]
MPTHSQSTACPPSPLDQGDLGPTLPATTNEHSLEPMVYRDITLDQAVSLLLGLQNQVLWLKQELCKTKEITKETQDWKGTVDQALTCIEARGGAQPHTPKDQKPLVVKEMPRPLHKANPLPAPSVPLIAWANPTKAPPAFAQPTPVQPPLQVPSSAPPLPI